MDHVYIGAWRVEILEIAARDVVHFRCRRGDAHFEVVADLTVGVGFATLSGVHVQGSGPNTVGSGVLLMLAREVRRWLGVDELRVEGATRTTGAGPGHEPRPFVIR